MMSGKSTYGRELARITSREFIDLDEIIEEGVSAGEIIRTKGEEVFREEETAALSRVLEGGCDCILALGGGTVVREENRALLRGRCRTIWLKAPLEESVFNPKWAHLTAQRPLLGDRERTEALYRSRIPAYTAAADIIIDTAGKKPGEVLSELVESLEWRSSASELRGQDGA